MKTINIKNDLWLGLNEKFTLCLSLDGHEKYNDKIYILYFFELYYYLKLDKKVISNKEIFQEIIESIFLYDDMKLFDFHSVSVDIYENFDSYHQDYKLLQAEIFNNYFQNNLKELSDIKKYVKLIDNCLLMLPLNLYSDISISFYKVMEEIEDKRSFKKFKPVAAYSQGTNVIKLNIKEINKENFLLVFLHELAHSIDLNKKTFVFKNHHSLHQSKKFLSNSYDFNAKVKQCYKIKKKENLNFLNYYTKPRLLKINNTITQDWFWTNLENFAESLAILFYLFSLSKRNIINFKNREKLKVLSPSLKFLLKNINWDLIFKQKQKIFNKKHLINLKLKYLNNKMKVLDNINR